MEKLIQFIKDNYTNFDVEINQFDSDTIEIKMKKNNKEEIKKKVEDFEKYVKEIDDDFFNDICDMFNGMSGINVNKLSKILDEKSDLKSIDNYINIFKNITKEYVKEHIKNLENKYLK